ncbi:SUKH-4 family immunity protein [Roseimicrobium sp. ORNL1]|uniref:SUKH-4 family immunity protein n=1 Tax=Roseimicrobium sp. ORNL1 TaxID=2711231 RepID=UPI0013E18682|nr:SUKH-4 family immunity protein [Roseimicrobium sp. ORNL1]QIF00604.1 hypothetical protein G5S37_03390 [Roseimicrobium sp. ORNL1]
MMNAGRFVSLWNDLVKQVRIQAEAAGVPEVADDLQLVKAPQSLLLNPLFLPDAARFLVEAGLPGGCAPFLTFEAIAQGPISLTQLLDDDEVIPTELSRLESFFVLGSDNYGDSLCLDASRGGAIVCLNHEDRFQTSQFVASSVATLAEALLLINTKVPYSEFIRQLSLVDSPAANESAYLPVGANLPG